MPTISIFAFLFALLFPGYLAYRELQKDRNWKVLSLALFLFCGSIYFGIYEILAKDENSKRDKEEIIESTKQGADDIKTTVQSSTTRIDSSLTEVRSEMDSGFRKSQMSLKQNWKRSDSVNYYGVPNISIGISNGIDIKGTATNDSIYYGIKLVNYSTVDAYNFKLKVYSIGIDNQLYHDLNTTPTLEDDAILKGSEQFTYTIKTSLRRGAPRFDSIYIYISASYSNYYRTVTKTYNECFLWTFEDKNWVVPPLAIRKKIASLIESNYGKRSLYRQ